jgi:drug/metabolite transporter (DMT)-like permease
MSLTAVLLLLISALIHAGWNLLSKRSTPTARFFAVANTLGAVVCLPWIVTHWSAVFRIPGPVWALIGVTGLFQAVYLASLAAAYRHGDLSITYPIARSLPVVLVPLAAFGLGRGEHLSTLFFAGAALVLAGGLLVPMEGPPRLHLRTLQSLSFLMAVCAGLGTAGYSLIDDQALRILRTALAGGRSSLSLTMIYLFFEALCCSTWLFFLSLPVSQKTADRVPLRPAALAGIGMYLAYALVLLAMAHARDVSFIVAFRQVSILVGAALGILVLKENAGPLKLTGIGLLICGLALVSLG